MTAASASALLIEAPVGRHFAQLHRDSRSLVDSVVLFIETGLRRGSAVVVFASESHTREFLKHLDNNGLDSEACRRSGQLIVRDAHAVLRQFMVRDLPDWRRFHDTIRTILESAEAHASSVRVYGELVNILWREGRPEAAHLVEVYWSELSRAHPFSLFCGYMLDGEEDPKASSDLLHDVGRTHSDVVLSTDEDEHFRVALDAASKDVFGVPLDRLLSNREDDPADPRAGGQSKPSWIVRHLPINSTEVLMRTRWHPSSNRAASPNRSSPMRPSKGAP
jgi:hypothetical protein